MYSPTFGRWLSPDPAGVAGGDNLYEYSKNDPINWDDPTGFAPEPATAPPAPGVTPSPVTEGPLYTPNPKMAPKMGDPAAIARQQAVAGLALGWLNHQLTVNQGLVDAQIHDRLAADYLAGRLSRAQIQDLYDHIVIVQWNSANSAYTGPNPVDANAQSVSKQWWTWYQAELAKHAADNAAAAAAEAASKTAPGTPGSSYNILLERSIFAKDGKAASPAAAGAGVGGPPVPPVATTQSATQPSKNYINLSTAGLTPDEVADLKEYVRLTNAWLSANNGAIVKSTAALAGAKAEAVRLEKLRMEAAGTPFPSSGAQLGHVPDTALSGQADPLKAIPPGGWLVMRGKSNSVAGGALGPLAPNSAGRVGQHVDGFTVDGSLP